MSVLMGASPCDTVLFQKMRLQPVCNAAKTPTVPNAEKPRTAGLCGRAGAETTPGLYLVLLSNRQVLSGFPHRRLKAGANSADTLSGVQGCHPRPQSRTQRLTGGNNAGTGGATHGGVAPSAGYGQLTCSFHACFSAGVFSIQSSRICDSSSHFAISKSFVLA